MQDILAILIVVVANLFGNFGRLSLPFIQKRKDRETELRELEEIPETQLTQDQKDRIAVLIKPISWRRHYTFTAVYGILISLGTTVGGIAALITLIPQDVPLYAILPVAGAVFFAGWGGNDVSNTLIKSTKSAGSAILQKLEINKIMSEDKPSSPQPSS